MNVSMMFLCAIYALRKTSQEARFFVPQSGCGKLIVNMMDNTIVCVILWSRCPALGKPSRRSTELS